MRKDVIDNQICQSIVAVNVVALIFRYKHGAVFFIGIDTEKSFSEEVYRIGQVVGVRNEAPLIAYFSKYIRSLKDGTRFCFIDELAGKKIGLWN